MSEHDFDEADPRIGAMLTAVGGEVAGWVRPAGAAAVRTRLRRRRRNRAIAGAVLAVALLAFPVAALATKGRSGPPVVGVEPSVSTSTPAPSTAEPSSAAQSPSAPDGRISASVLKNSTLQIPPWPQAEATTDCRQGAVRFANGLDAEASNGVLDWIVGNPVYVDVDHDGAQETVAVIGCRQWDARFQVLVFDRDASGQVITFGRVLRSSEPNAKAGIDILYIWGVKAGGDGQIQVDVGEYRPDLTITGDAPQHQWRTYGWNGQRFTQTGGPTRFGANPNVTDLKITGTDPVAAQQADGTWMTTVTVTVHNNGPSTVPPRLLVDSSAAQISSGCTLDTVDQSTGGLACQVGSLAKGASKQVTFTVKSLGVPTGTISFRVDHHNTASERHPDTGSQYPDLNDEDNTVVLTFRTS